MKVKAIVRKRIKATGGEITYSIFFKIIDEEPFGTSCLLKRGENNTAVVMDGIGSSDVTIYAESLEEAEKKIAETIDMLRTACEKERAFQASLPKLPEPQIYVI